MSKIYEMKTYNSLSLKQYHRLPVVSVGSNYFVNVNRNSIARVHEQKLLHTWMLKNPNSFTCPVVYNTVDKTVCCVIDYNILLIWSESDESLDSSIKIKFQESIFAILPVIDEKPIIIFTNGKCLPLDHAVAGTKTPFGEDVNEEENLIWADASTQHSKFIIQLVTFNKLIRKHFLYCFTLKKEDNLIEHFASQELSNGKHFISSWCMNKYTKELLFMAVWSDGSIIHHCPSNNSTKVLLKIPNTKISDLLAIDVIDRYHIALMRTNDKKSECMLEIWDTKFLILENTKNFSVLPSNFFQICVLGSNIFFSSDDNLVVFPIRVESSTLASAIGKSESKSSTYEICKWGENGEVDFLNFNQGTVDFLEDHDASEKTKTQRIIYYLLESVKLNPSNILEDTAFLLTVSESDIVKALHFVLKRCAEATEQQNDLNRLLLNILFSIPYSDIFLIKELRSLTFNNLLVILEVLLLILSDTDTIISHRPSDYQIISWTYLVLQSRVEEILLAKDEKVFKILSQFHKIVLKKIEEANTEEEILHVLELLGKGNILPEGNSRSNYCIEVLLI